MWDSPFTLLRLTETWIFLDEREPSDFNEDPGNDRYSISLRGTLEMRFGVCPSPPTVFLEIWDFTLLRM